MKPTDGASGWSSTFCGASLEGVIGEAVAVAVGGDLREARAVGPSPVVAADRGSPRDVRAGAGLDRPGVRREGPAGEGDVEVVLEAVVVDRAAPGERVPDAGVGAGRDDVPRDRDAVRIVEVEPAFVALDPVTQDCAAGRAGGEDDAVPVARDVAARDRVPRRVQVEDGPAEEVLLQHGRLDPRVRGPVEVDAGVPVPDPDVFDRDVPASRRDPDVDPGRVRGTRTVDQVPAAVEDDVRGPDLDAGRQGAVRDVVRQDVRAGAGDRDRLAGVRQVRRGDGNGDAGEEQERGEDRDEDERPALH